MSLTSINLPESTLSKTTAHRPIALGAIDSAFLKDPFPEVLVSDLRSTMAKPPHLIIGPKAAPYLRRWIWEEDAAPGTVIYLHEILAEDYGRESHDHPWASTAKILHGWYGERLGRAGTDQTTLAYRGKGDVVCRMPGDWHRIEEVSPGGCLTLFATGPAVQDWGFWCPGKGKISHKAYVDPDNPGAIGAGCGEVLPEPARAAIDREAFE